MITLLPDFPVLAVFLLAMITLNFTPGPAMLYVVARSVGQGRAAGVVSALGVGAGTVAHTFLAALGLSAVLLSSAAAFQWVKFAGSAYLIYLGLRLLWSRPETNALPQATRESARRLFLQGFLTNLLNPKVALFFLAFLPQFVDPARGSVAVQMILLGLIYNCSATLAKLGVAFVSGSLASWFWRAPGFARWQRRFTGGTFILLGAGMVLADRR